jgi:MATE family multidrug resistance protein
MAIEHTKSQEPIGLTRYPVGSFREFLVITIPLILFFLSGHLMGFCDRLFLSRYSTEALEACTSTLALCALFQLSAVRVISVVQAFIGQYKGAGELQKIGQSVWQMIWLSLFIFLVSLPMGFVVEPLFFRHTPIASLGVPYFRFLLPLNFLLPLGAALSSFYVGQGKTKIVLYAMLCGHLTQFILDPWLIFGIKGVIPSLGVRGAAIAMVSGHIVYCSLLFLAFLKRENRKLYGTRYYALQWSLLWECLRIGVPRSLSRILILLNWAAVVRFLTLKGGNYLLVLSFGGSIHLLFLFVIEGMGQAILTMSSYIVGMKQLSLIRNLKRNAGWLIMIMMALLSIPYLFYTDVTISFIFPNLQDIDAQRLLRDSCYWSFLFFICQALNSIWHNLLTALRDTMFQMIYSAFASWLILYGTIYATVEIGECAPDKIWIATSAASFITAWIYSMRVRKLFSSIQPSTLSPLS